MRVSSAASELEGADMTEEDNKRTKQVMYVCK
jgi:hypothetical protein